MKNSDYAWASFIAFVLIGGIVAFGAFCWHQADQRRDACERAGGVYISGRAHHYCLKGVEEIHP